MLQKLLEKLAGAPTEVLHQVSQLKPGAKVAIEGTIRSAQPIEAPIGGATCVGYYYKCTHKVNSRLKGYIRRKLRDVLVYAPGLEVVLEDGPVPVVPLRNDTWSALHHQALLQEDYMDFKATEKLIRPGSKVKVVGKYKQGPEGLAVYFQELYLLEEPRDKKPAKPKVRKGFRKPPTSKKKAGKKPRR